KLAPTDLELRLAATNDDAFFLKDRVVSVAS
ncbi:MAG: hypothetical protein K0R45_3200, partial [Pseudomonas sp.]|nr:hypothetical protein [Pseudomonas sp.]